MATRSTGRHLGVIFVLVGGLLLVMVMLTPWYANNGTFGFPPSQQHLDTTFYLGLPWWNGSVQISCDYAPCAGETSYAAFSTSDQVVAGITWILVIASSGLAIIASAYGLGRRRNSYQSSFVMTLAVAALVLGSAAPAFYAAAFQLGYGGPQGSFWGSSSSPFPTTGPPIAYSWGPDIGWYLSIAAAAVLLTGAVVLIRHRCDRLESASSFVQPEPQSR
jgi:hypothetical protein